MYLHGKLFSAVSICPKARCLRYENHTGMKTIRFLYVTLHRHLFRKGNFLLPAVYTPPTILEWIQSASYDYRWGKREGFCFSWTTRIACLFKNLNFTQQRIRTINSSCYIDAISFLFYDRNFTTQGGKQMREQNFWQRHFFLLVKLQKKK